MLDAHLFGGEYRKVLDIGCGTGFQSYLYTLGGSSVIGIEISKNMIHSANNKNKKNSSLDKFNLILFPEKFGFVKKYNILMNSYFNKQRNNKSKPNFMVADIYDLPFANQSFHHINCCGSVLSLIDEHKLALREISLRQPGQNFSPNDKKGYTNKVHMILHFIQPIFLFPYL